MSATHFTATADIYAAPGVLAFLTGQTVPASAVENLNCRDKVTAERKPAANAVKGAAKEA